MKRDTLIENIIKTTFETSDKLYIHAMPTLELSIGNRGLIGEELERGIILSLTASSCKELDIGDMGVTAKLKFSGVWEDVFIPYASIVAILDDLREPSFVFNFRSNNIDNEYTNSSDITNTDIADKIIKIDFSKT